MIKRKGFWKTISIMGLSMSWLMEALIYNFKGYTNWAYVGVGTLFLILLYLTWND